MGLNTLRIWPISPPPADMQRQPIWNENAVHYDCDAFQGSTSWVKPLYKYVFSHKNLPRSQQSSLHNFVNLQRGQVTPFLFQDPYDNRAGNVTVLGSGNVATSFYIFDANSFQIVPKS